MTLATSGSGSGYAHILIVHKSLQAARVALNGLAIGFGRISVSAPSIKRTLGRYAE